LAFEGMKTAGRYALLAELDRGGMATVHLGAELGAATPIVACKTLHPHLSAEEEFRARFLDEARLVSRIDHPNVVRMLEVVDADGELTLVMPYIFGVSLSELARAAIRRGERAPLPVVSRLVSGVLAGLHAAHEARTEDGVPLRIVHRDVSPRNVVVGVDGVARLLDFGIARASVRSVPATTTGNVRGTPTYMAPEQAKGEAVTRQTDVFTAGILLWELSTGRRLNADCAHEAQFLLQLIQGTLPRARTWAPHLSPALEAVIERAMELAPADRFETAEAMELALCAAVPPASTAEVAAWMVDVVADELAKRAKLLARVEAMARGEAPTASAPAPSVPRSEVVTETAADGPGHRWREGAAVEAPTHIEPASARSAAEAAAVTALFQRPASVSAVIMADPARAAPDNRGTSAGPALRSGIARGLGAGVGVAFGILAALFVSLTFARVPPGQPARSGLGALVVARLPPVELPAPTSAAVPPAASLSVAAAPVAPLPPSARPASIRPAPARCNPPTYVDARGVIRIKSGCSGR
jgi:hypothetical protein